MQPQHFVYCHNTATTQSYPWNCEPELAAVQRKSRKASPRFQGIRPKRRGAKEPFPGQVRKACLRRPIQIETSQPAPKLLGILSGGIPIPSFFAGGSETFFGDSIRGSNLNSRVSGV